ncbi:hypothetical protein PRNP1_003669 [Phytophthora ramorum]
MVRYALRQLLDKTSSFKLHELMMAVVLMLAPIYEAIQTNSQLQELRQKSKRIRVLRRTMAEVDARGKLVVRDSKLTLAIDGREVAVGQQEGRETTGVRVHRTQGLLVRHPQENPLCVEAVAGCRGERPHGGAWEEIASKSSRAFHTS